MGRGQGQTQRRILGCLAGGRLLTVVDITDCVYGRRALEPQSRSHRESVRRALLALEQRGLVRLSYVVSGEYPNARQHLAAQLAAPEE